MQRRVRGLAERAQAERERHRSVDTAFDMVDRDLEFGGGIIAGAIAYRLFLWLLPLALVAVGGLGLAAGAAHETPGEAADSLGVAGLVSRSVEDAARGSARWYALLVGIPVLLVATRSVLRVLIGAHRLLWADVRTSAPKPSPMSTIRLLALLLGFYVVAGLSSAVRASSPGAGLLLTVLASIPFAGLWLLVTLRLPHRDADWTALVPGALLFGLGIEVIHVVSAYVIVPYASSKQGTYGALGIAAALLVGLFLISRLVVTAAVLNATLWERGARDT